MRIKLVAGQQSKLIKQAKSKQSLSWKQLSNKLGFSKGYVKNEIYHEKALLPENTYKTLCFLANKNFNKFIIEKKLNNWGQTKGGQLSKTKPKNIKLLLKNHSSKLAEAIGIILGDGNIWVKSGYYYVRIGGHLHEDRKYLLNFVKPLFQNLFNIKFNILENKKGSQLILSKGSKNLVFTLKKFGLKFGNKKAENVKIPEWVFSSKKYLKACIRGLIDTDGSVCPITGRNYSYIWFKSAIPGIRKSFSKAMKILNIKTSAWSNSNPPQIFIGSKRNILKYYVDIGFSNLKHEKRFSCPGSVARSKKLRVF